MAAGANATIPLMRYLDRKVGTVPPFAQLQIRRIGRGELGDRESSSLWHHQSQYNGGAARSVMSAPAATHGSQGERGWVCG